METSRMKKKSIWIMRGDSESGDHYDSKRYDHEPTEQDKRDYIKNETPEELDCDGDGDCGSYVYLTIEHIE